eukprot:scaffold8658_cov101-Cylindrotheca_fusiformis.AAC.4
MGQRRGQYLAKMEHEIKIGQWTCCEQELFSIGGWTKCPTFVRKQVVSMRGSTVSSGWCVETNKGTNLEAISHSQRIGVLIFDMIALFFG